MGVVQTGFMLTGGASESYIGFNLITFYHFML